MDPEAAKVVKRIFKLYMEGSGTTCIATILRKEKVLSPSAYREEKSGASCGRKNHDPYGWSDRAVSRILRNESYTGTTVNFKTKRVSFNSKMRVETSEAERDVIEKTHEAIIDEATFLTVQKLLEHRKRLVLLEEDTCPLTGIVYCANCSRLMYNVRGRSESITDTFRCSGSQLRYGCTGHRIRADDLTAIVEKKVKGMLLYCQENEDEFLKRTAAESKENTNRKKELRAAEKRLEKIENTFMSLYEDKASGVITEQEFMMLVGRYNTEQKELKDKVEALKKSINTIEDRKKAARAFLTAARKCQGFETFTTEIQS